MKKILTLIMAFAVMVNTSNAAFTESKTEKKKQHSLLSTDEKRAAAEFFVKLSRKDYEELSGKHLGLAERLAFKIAQKQVKKELKRVAETEGFNISGFLLGFLLGLIGLLIAYLASKDDNLRKWALIGFGAAVIFSIIFLIIILAALKD